MSLAKFAVFKVGYFGRSVNSDAFMSAIEVVFLFTSNFTSYNLFAGSDR